MGLDQNDKGGFIGAGRPGGPGGNKVPTGTGGDPVMLGKTRPQSSLGAIQSTGTKGNDRNAVRKSRPKSTGSGQSTAHK